MAFDQGKYANEYTKANYDRLTILVPKGKGELVKAAAKANGLTTTQLVISALENSYKLDLSPSSGG